MITVAAATMVVWSSMTGVRGDTALGRRRREGRAVQGTNAIGN